MLRTSALFLLNGVAIALMLGIAEIAHIFFTEYTGGEPVFRPKCPDQVAFVGKATVYCDLSQRLCRCGHLHTGGTNLLPQPEGVDGHIGDFLKVGF